MCSNDLYLASQCEVKQSGMSSPPPGLGLEAQKTGLGLMTFIASASSSLASWPRSF